MWKMTSYFTGPQGPYGRERVKSKTYKMYYLTLTIGCVPQPNDPPLGQCWTTVYDAGPTLTQQWVYFAFIGYVTCSWLWLIYRSRYVTDNNRYGDPADHRAVQDTAHVHHTSLSINIKQPLKNKYQNINLFWISHTMPNIQVQEPFS